MAGLLDGVMDQLGPGGVAKIAGALGVSDDQAGAAINAALPALLGGMAVNSQKPGGAQSLASAVGNHSPSIFDHIGGVLKNENDGKKIVDHVLGAKQNSVEQNLAGQSGVSSALIAKVLPMLAPLVMGYLAKQMSSGGLDAGGLGSMLNKDQKQAEAKSPGLGGLASILDSDGDGSIIDDVMGMATGGGASKGGLGGLLGKMFGK